jgi:predicted Fe-S protein YdhL (DUF1289 family)
MATPLVSPCIHICTLNAQQECIGCLRSLEEIAQWRHYSDAERETIMRRIQTQRQAEERETSKTVQNSAWEEKHERVCCLRCGERFACKINSPTRCDCMDIRLTSNEMEYILPLADGECLCPNCLEKLRAEYRLLHGF